MNLWEHTLAKTKHGRFLIFSAAALIVSAIYFLTACRKDVSETHPEFVGKWSNTEALSGFTFDGTVIEIKEDGSGSYEKIKGGRTVNGSGKAKIKKEQLIIGVIKLSIDAYPAQVETAAGRFDTFIILEGDTFFKAPKVRALPCENGFKDGNETGIDCGGRCAVCPSCRDAIMNQGESAVDCGGPCEPCLEAPCIVQFSKNSGTIKSCGSGSILPLQYNSTYTAAVVEDEGYRYWIHYYGQNWYILLGLPGKPQFKLTYDIDEHWNMDVEPAYDSAGVFFKYWDGTDLSGAYVPSGKLHVDMANDTATATFCNLQVFFEKYGCVNCSARLKWPLK